LVVSDLPEHLEKEPEAGFVDWAEVYFSWDVGNPYAIVLVGGPHDGELVGTSTLTDFDPARGTAHWSSGQINPRRRPDATASAREETPSLR
jgi:hypothetical protein